MVSNELLRSTFEAGRSYGDYVRTGTPDQQRNWGAFHAQAGITDSQRSLLAGFTRRMHVVVSSGMWCGDCVQQCPFFDHIEKANPGKIAVRFVDRDEQAGFAGAIRICGGMRVPVVVFANEDFDFVSLLGDRTLTRYRALAARQLGPSCPLPGAAVPADEIAATLSDWVGEFERVQLLLRLSTKLRERHGD